MNLDIPVKLYRRIPIVRLFFPPSTYKTSLVEWHFKDCSRGRAEHETVVQYPLFLPSAFLCLQVHFYRIRLFLVQNNSCKYYIFCSIKYFQEKLLVCEYFQKYSIWGHKTYFFNIGFNIIPRFQFTLSEIVYFLACSGRMFCLNNVCYICRPLLSPIFNHPKHCAEIVC